MSRFALFTTASLAVLAFGIPFAALCQESFDSWALSGHSSKGATLSPVVMNLANRRPDLVNLGSYIVNAQGGCNSCHTCPSFRGRDPFREGGAAIAVPGSPIPVNAKNYLAGGVPFGTIKSGNLTPNAAGLPGGMTFEQFAAAMQNGQDPHLAGRILQVMPWTVFRNLFDGDLAAVYEYLKTIPSAQPGSCSGPGQTAN
jgi:hypothetical protein